MPQPPERCLNRKAGIVRCCPRCNNTHDFVPKSCVKDAAPPFGIPAHITHGRCRFAAQKRRAPQRRTPAVCGEGKALLRKCNNPLCFQPCGLQSVVGSPKGRLYRVRFGQIVACVRKIGTHVRSKTAKFSCIGVFFHWRIWYTRFSSVNRYLTRYW